MRFPNSARVVYGRTPLVEVICQLKFPPILKIDAEPPVAVQERLRAELPNYEKAELGLLSASMTIADGQPVLTAQPTPDRRAEHTFLAPDGSSKVVVGRDFVALSTTAYARWETFQSSFAQALAAVTEAYAPHSFTRVGLRYQNVVRRDWMGVGGLPWSELLRPTLIGLLAEPVGSPLQPAAATREDVFLVETVDGPGNARVIHGLVEYGSERGYLIDADFSVDGTFKPPVALALLEDLHTQSRDFFRLCVTDRLHEAMKPEAIDAEHART